MLAHPINRVNITMATAAMVFAVVAFMFAVSGNSTPCANAQTSQCSIGDDEIIAGDLTLQEELVVGATPSAGTAGQILESQGSNLSPEWVAAPNPAPTFVYKSADETTTVDAVLSNDTHLQFTVSANTKYAFEGVLLVSESGGDTAGHWLALRPNPPSGTADMIVSTDPTDSSISSAVNFASESASGDCQGDLTNPDLPCHFAGTIEVGGSGGPFAIEWAQNASQAVTIQVGQGSWISYIEIP